MTSVQYLEILLKDLFSKFPSGNIRYEYRPNRKSHVIEVTPIDLFDDEDYKLAELLLEQKFETEFPQESIIFVSTNSLNRVTSPILELLGEKKLTLCIRINSEEQHPIDADQNNTQYAGEYNFASAA
jgi:hypothetical protein